MLFSQRKGFTKVSNNIQKDYISSELRNRLWNVLETHIWSKYISSESQYHIFFSIEFDNYLMSLFDKFLKAPLQKKPGTCGTAYKFLEGYFFNSEWYKVYDFLEFTIDYFLKEKIVNDINTVLSEELSAYRYVHNLFTEITASTEIEMLEEALSENKFPGVTKHLQRGFELLSDRDQPDYRNSIKESISAVESIVTLIVSKPKSSLGDALKLLDKQKKIHPALIKSFESLYGYTSDEDGIRHSMLEEPNLTADDAKFFLLSCTSFINYLKTKI